MKLPLKKSLCFFDLETTGIDYQNDKIVQIAILKMNLDGSEKTYCQILNPEIKIPQSAIDIHGITNDMVQNKPTFRDEAPVIFNLLNNSDLAGYNIQHFDLKFLATAFYNEGFFHFDAHSFKMIDVKNIFFKKQPRTLKAAMKFYCNDQDFENKAHDALEDVKATKQVLLGQLKMYDDLVFDVDQIDAEYNQQLKFVDIGFNLIRNQDNEIEFYFGKYKGHTVRSVAKTDMKYIRWILNKQFHPTTLTIIKNIINSL